MSRFVILAVLFASLAPLAHAQYVRPGKEVRTINTDVYEISIQKNGRTDINLTTREPVFQNVFPMVQFAEDPSPKALQIDGRYSTRTEVNDRLGQGHGLLIARENFEWHLRAYPAKPFLTVSLAYTNNSRTPLRVAALLPWCVGTPKGGALRIGPVAEEAVVLAPGMTPAGESGDGLETFAAQWSLAAVAPSARRSLIAGFLTTSPAATHVELHRSPKAPADVFDHFQAVCTYDPPITLQPGERMESELLYIAVGETDPLLGLERLAKAMAVVNGVRDERPFKPHGWQSSPTLQAADEQSILHELAFMASNLKRYGWNHVTIGTEWELTAGDWEPDPARFPQGMAAISAAAHAEAMTVGLALSPFLVDANSAVAREHPEWLLMPTAGQSKLHPEQRVLDVTRPEVLAHVSAIAGKIRRTWGFDAIVVSDAASSLLLANDYANEVLTQPEILHLGLEALQEGFGPGGFILSGPPDQISGQFAHAMGTGRENAPLWTGTLASGAWGARDSLAATIRGFHMAPHMYLLNPGAAYWGNDSSRRLWQMESQPRLTDAQGLAWFTAAALTGGVLQAGEAFSGMNETQLAVLKRLLPVAEKPARPIDLFRNEHPQIWSLPLTGEAGQWHILGLFNWGTTDPQTLTVHLAELGLDPEAYHTVYDFWADRFYGLSRETLQIEVPPGSVRVIGLRPYEDRPMFLAHDRHFTQGALEYRRIAWEEPAKSLNGLFDAISDTTYAVRLHVPAGFRTTRITLDGQEIAWSSEGPVLQFTFHVDEPGQRAWKASFEKTGP